MSDPSSITAWLDHVKEGGPQRERSAQKLWDRYLLRLIGLARTKMRAAHGRAADAEDVVQEAFEAFFRAAQRGQLPKLNDRHDLWPLLVKITERKAIDLRKHENRRIFYEAKGQLEDLDSWLADI